jgi:molybdate transport system substrate-binding protein
MMFLCSLRAGVAAALIAILPLAAHAADVTVFAAASLTDALQTIGKSYQAKTGKTVVFSFAASSVLAKQIEASGGADMFISADTDWMDYLDKKGLIQKATRTNLLGNHLVLIAQAGTAAAVTIRPHFDLKSALAGGRLAVADPASVPAGKYAKAALTSLGVWDSVSGNLAQAENVRAALAYVARGEAPLGIVYTTDAMSEPKVRIAGEFPDASHPPIIYPAALTKDASADAKGFLAYLSSPEAKGIFAEDGFVILGK